jgi:hypothetical protein
VLPPVADREMYSPSPVITQSLGINCIVANVSKRRTQVFLVLFCYLYTDADQMRVESNIVHFLRFSVQTWPKNDCAHNQHAAGSHDAVA